MSEVTTCFLALEPDETLFNTVLARKQQVRELSGDQQFLGDPPHSTLYLARFSDPSAIVSPAAALARDLQTPQVELTGWHVFADDQLTGKHTLVCGLGEASKRNLRDVQRRFVESVAPLRDRDHTRARYDTAWDRLAPQERGSVDQWGFPYVGSIWQPHVTIASIDHDAWPTVWSELESLAPHGTAKFPAICLYALDGDRPTLLERFTAPGCS